MDELGRERTVPIVSSGPSVGYPEMIAAFSTVLRATGELLLADDQRMSLSGPGGQKLLAQKDGRDAATVFEKDILSPFLDSEADAITRHVEENLSQLPGPWRFSQPRFVTEAKTRAGRDYWLHLLAHHPEIAEPVELRQMVNAKYTAAATKDNTGGASMFAWALLGAESLMSTRAALPDAYAKLDELADTPTDYFFWVFTHEGNDKTTVASSVLVDTLLVADPATCMGYNTAQSWPSVQMDHRKAAGFKVPESTTRARRRFLDWLLDQQSRSLVEAVAAHERTYALLGKQPVVVTAQPSAGSSARVKLRGKRRKRKK